MIGDDFEQIARVTQEANLSAVVISVFDSDTGSHWWD
jgi:hypothetical protein